MKEEGKTLVEQDAERPGVRLLFCREVLKVWGETREAVRPRLLAYLGEKNTDAMVAASQAIVREEQYKQVSRQDDRRLLYLAKMLGMQVPTLEVILPIVANRDGEMLGVGPVPHQMVWDMMEAEAQDNPEFEKELPADWLEELLRRRTAEEERRGDELEPDLRMRPVWFCPRCRRFLRAPEGMGAVLCVCEDNGKRCIPLYAGPADEHDLLQLAARLERGEDVEG